MHDGTGLDLLEEMDILQSKGNSWRTNLNRHRENRDPDKLERIMDEVKYSSLVKIELCIWQFLS